jgi:hypothetical protein
MKMSSQKGAAAVEFALVLPLLLVLLFGIIEFSVLLYDKAMLTNASREGARVGIVYVPNRSANIAAVNSRIESAVNAYAENFLISFGDESTLQINPSSERWVDGDDSGSSPYDSGDFLNVEVSYDFRFLVFSNLLTLVGGTNLDDVFNLRAVTRMRLE